MSDIVIKRTIPAPPEKVFQLWTDPEQVKKWWGPKGVTCTEVQIDLRPGGSYRIANQFADGTVVWIHGSYELVEPPNQLRYTWGLGLDSPAHELVTIRFERVTEGTEVRILHENIPNEQAAAGHGQGWEGCLDGLESYANG
jgi:uncharacterized protein YndB with AHSA1/START domain